jgi:hypothetical protein
MEIVSREEADYLTETMEVKRQLNDIFKIRKENNCNSNTETQSITQM